MQGHDQDTLGRSVVQTRSKSKLRGPFKVRLTAQVAGAEGKKQTQPAVQAAGSAGGRDERWTVVKLERKRWMGSGGGRWWKVGKPERHKSVVGAHGEIEERGW